MKPCVLVTGATDGIGRASAQALHDRGWRVLVHGRTKLKAEKTARALNPDKNIATPVWGNFEVMDEVAALATQVISEVDALDALLNNAGIYPAQRKITADGFELTMAVNHFAPFLLTNRLIKLLKAANSARIVTVSSTTHNGASLNVDDLLLEHKCDSYAAYSASKLANILFTRQPARNLDKTRVTANSLHPGVVRTKLLRKAFSGGGTSVEDGARTSVYLVGGRRVAGVSGKYFVDSQEQPASKKAQDLRLARALWGETTALLIQHL